MDDKQISKLVKADIESKIIKAFKETPEMIDNLVRACLEHEVDSQGLKPDWHSKEKMPYLTWLARDAIQLVANTAVREHIKEMEPQIKEQVKKALSTKDVVDAFTKKIIYATGEDWRIDVNFKVDKNDK